MISASERHPDHRVERDPDLLTLAKWREPGMPRSREKAKHIREALVRQARPQKSCPTVQISSTALNPAELSALERIASESRRRSRSPIGDEGGVLHGEGDRQQDDPADHRRVEDRRPYAARRVPRGAVGLLGDVAEASKPVIVYCVSRNPIGSR